MAKEEFKVAQTGERNETKFTEEGNQKVRTLSFKGIEDDGTVIKVSISGPIDIIEKRFAAFPLGSGVSLKAVLSSSQATLTGALSATNSQQKQSTDLIKADAADGLEKLDEEIDALL